MAASILAIIVMLLPFVLECIRRRAVKGEIADEMGKALADRDTARIRDLLDELHGES